MRIIRINISFAFRFGDRACRTAQWRVTHIQHRTSSIDPDESPFAARTFEIKYFPDLDFLEPSSLGHPPLCGSSPLSLCTVLQGYSTDCGTLSDFYPVTRTLGSADVFRFRNPRRQNVGFRLGFTSADFCL